MALCPPLFTDEEHAALQVTVSTPQSRTIRCYTSEKLVQMCTVKIESGLGYKSSQDRVQVQVQHKWT